MREYTSRAFGPEMRITPIPPFPGGVDSAYIVFFSIGDGTTLDEKRLNRHNSRIVAFREDSIAFSDGTEDILTKQTWELIVFHTCDREIHQGSSYSPVLFFSLHKLCHAYERVGCIPEIALPFSLKGLSRD